MEEITKPSLSGRELEVLDLIGKGLSTVKVAEKLCLSPNTIKAHVARISLKLGVKGRTESIVTAFRSKLIN